METRRGDAAAAAWRFRGGASRRRRDADVRPRPARVHRCTNQTCGDGPTHQSTGNQTTIADWADAWHEYAIEYSPSGVRWAFDGVFYYTAPRGIFWNTSYYVILNTAVGGDHDWPGPPDNTTVFPTYHFVDYVRVATLADEGDRNLA